MDSRWGAAGLYTTLTKAARNRPRSGGITWECYDRIEMSRFSIDSRRLRRLAREARRIAALLVIVGVIRLLHATTHEPEPIWHGLLLRLYYIPILVSAYWYGAFGGLLVAILSSMAYAPHLRENRALEAGRYVEIVFFT